jgi:hypothetical protein
MRDRLALQMGLADLTSPTVDQDSIIHWNHEFCYLIVDLDRPLGLQEFKAP